jgi:hypothetical protein
MINEIPCEECIALAMCLNRKFPDIYTTCEILKKYKVKMHNDFDRIESGLPSYFFVRDQFDNLRTNR